jgi:hypothetical protein
MMSWVFAVQESRHSENPVAVGASGVTPEDNDQQLQRVLLLIEVEAVGDFGLCFLLDDDSADNERITETMEVAGPRWFGAPESRDGRLEDVRLTGDVYSLGKVIHWMFSRRPFDREDLRSERNSLGRGLADRREYELVHQLLDRMIVHEPLGRYANAEVAALAVTGLIQVLEANGRPILIKFAHRCGFCGQGEY